jgi:hypothetical protein
MPNSPLYLILKAEADDIFGKVSRDCVEPWVFFRSKGVNIEGSDGRRISISGVEYSGSAVAVFWSSIDPLLKKKAREFIERTRVLAHERGVSLKAALRDCQNLIHSAVFAVFDRMAVIDQRLRGNGSPRSVQKRDTVSQADKIVKEIDRLIEAEMSLLPSGNRRPQKDGTVTVKSKWTRFGILLGWICKKTDPDIEALLSAAEKGQIDQLLASHYTLYTSENWQEIIGLCKDLKDEGYLQVEFTAGLDGRPVFLDGPARITIPGREYLKKIKREKLWKVGGRFLIATMIAAALTTAVGWLVTRLLSP